VINITGTPSQIIVDATVATVDLANAVRQRMAVTYASATVTVKQSSDGKSQQLQLTLPFKNALADGVQKP
jgi:hypothetical protein